MLLSIVMIIWIPLLGKFEVSFYVGTFFFQTMKLWNKEFSCHFWDFSCIYVKFIVNMLSVNLIVLATGEFNWITPKNEKNSR